MINGAFRKCSIAKAQSDGYLAMILAGKARRLVEGMTAGAVVGNLAGMAIAKRASTTTMDDGVVERARKAT